MLLGKRFMILTLTMSLALNALLLAMIVSSTTLMNRLSEQMEQNSAVVTELTNNHRTTLTEAAQLREELRGCRIDLIKRVLGISHPKPQAAPPAPKTQAS